MNTDLEMAALYNARSEGKVLQVFGVGSVWHEIDKHDAINAEGSYRIKPEPEVLYANKPNISTSGIFYTSEVAALGNTDEVPGGYSYIAKKFIEVIE